MPPLVGYSCSVDPPPAQTKGGQAMSPQAAQRSKRGGAAASAKRTNEYCKVHTCEEL